jgi:hypothetical protein
MAEYLFLVLMVVVGYIVVPVERVYTSGDVLVLLILTVTLAFIIGGISATPRTRRY